MHFFSIHSGPIYGQGLLTKALWSLRCRPNVWPGEALPELEPAFKELGRLMMDVGLRLTEHCDQYVAQRGGPPQPGTLQQILLRSPCPKVEHLRLPQMLYSGSAKVCICVVWLAQQLHAATAGSLIALLPF